MPQQPKGSAKENAIRGILVMVAKVAANAAGEEIDDQGLLEIEQLALPALMAIVTPERDAIRGIVTMVARVASTDVDTIPDDLEELAVPALMAILAQEERREGPGATDGEETDGRAAEEGASPLPYGSKGDLRRPFSS